MSLKSVSDFFSILDGAGREAMGKALDHDAFESGGKAHDTFERGGRVHATFESRGRAHETIESG